MSAIPKRLYLAGPMAGLPEHNRPLFNEVAGRLREHGYEVFNPAENEDGGVFQGRAFYMRLDIPALLASEAVVLLPGWQQSRGANLEVWLATDLDMPLFACSLNGRAPALERMPHPELDALPFSAEIRQPAESTVSRE